MTGLTGLTGPTVLLLVSLCALSLTQEDKDALDVKYLQRTINATLGSSHQLTCDVTYDVTKCGLLRATWYHLGNTSNEQLTDPSRYATTVSETEGEDGLRLRVVLTEILHVMPQDRGQFHCKAQCENGENIVGHIIQVNVAG